ncbi:MAG: hypothetical protein KF723_20575 [Rhizobiaceae bacterium]|nr:hypothetical protein [Rhizobiaceae bacterium]
MVMMEIRDNVIWAKHVKADARLYETVMKLPEFETIKLSVDGIKGEWEKMKLGSDGRPVAGIKPIGSMADVWKRWQVRRGEKVAVELPGTDPDPFLKLADRTFEEWYSAEDEEAYGELRPL